MERDRARVIRAFASIGHGPRESRLAESAIWTRFRANGQAGANAPTEADEGAGEGTDSDARADAYRIRAFAAVVDAIHLPRAGEDEPLKTIVDFGSKPLTETSVRCRRCKSTHVRSEARQTRSADEAPTLFFDCRDCGARWRCYC